MKLRNSEQAPTQWINSFSRRRRRLGRRFTVSRGLRKSRRNSRRHTICRLCAQVLLANQHEKVHELRTPAVRRRNPVQAHIKPNWCRRPIDRAIVLVTYRNERALDALATRRAKRSGVSMQSDKGAAPVFLKDTAHDGSPYLQFR